jgi:hypothetical protein
MIMLNGSAIADAHDAKTQDLVMMTPTRCHRSQIKAAEPPPLL